MTESFVAPFTLTDVLQAIAGGAVPLAGGTDLVVGHRQGKRPLPPSLVNLDRVVELRGTTFDASGSVRIAALTTHDSLMADPLVCRNFSAIADASSIVGSAATRCTGTIGGNVMNASPAADTTAPLLCLSAVAVLQSIDGTRRVPLSELFVGPGRTVAVPGELLVAVELPAPGATSGSAYVRLEYRRHMEIAVVGAAAYVRLGPDGRVAEARIAMTALAPTVRLVPEAAAALVGSLADSAASSSALASAIASAVELAGEAVAAASAPISDVRGSADYRRAMAAVITRRAIRAAIERAKGVEVRIPASDSTFGVTQ